MKKNKNKNKTNVIFKVNVVIFSLIILAGMLHVVSANYAANQRFEIARYTDMLRENDNDRSKLYIAVAELQSLERLKIDSARLNLVKVSKAYYISPQGTVALHN